MSPFAIVAALTLISLSCCCFLLLMLFCLHVTVDYQRSLGFLFFELRAGVRLKQRRRRSYSWYATTLLRCCTSEGTTGLSHCMHRTTASSCTRRCPRQSLLPFISAIFMAHGQPRAFFLYSDLLSWLQLHPFWRHDSHVLHALLSGIRKYHFHPRLSSRIFVPTLLWV